MTHVVDPGMWPGPEHEQAGAGRQTPRPEYAKGQNRLSWFSGLRNVVFALREHKPGRDLLSHRAQEGR